MSSVTPIVAAQPRYLPVSSPSSPRPSAQLASPKKTDALRVDIFVRSADTPAEPGALSIEGEGVSKVVNALRTWSSAVQSLLGAFTSLPPFIREMTELVRSTVTQLLDVVGTKGKQMHSAAQDVYRSVRG